MLNALQVGLISEVMFLLSSSCTKISILLFYRRLVDRSYSKWIQWSIYIAIGFTMVYLLAISLFLATFCSPTASAWQSLDLNYSKAFRCADRAVVDPLVGVISAFSDIYAIALPELVVYRLKMPRKQKLVLYAIFGAGLLVVVAALLRIGFFVRLHTDPRRDITCTYFSICCLWSYRTNSARGRLRYPFVDGCRIASCDNLRVRSGTERLFLLLLWRQLDSQNLQ